MTSYLTSIDTFSLSRTVFEIFDFKLFRVWPWPLTFRGHSRSNFFILFECLYMTSYLTSIDTFLLFCTVFEIFDFKLYMVWPWPLTSIGHLGSKKIYTIRKPIYDFLFDFYRHHLSILYRSRDNARQNLWRPHKMAEFDLFKGRGHRSIFFYPKKGISSNQTASFEILCIKIGFCRLGCSRDEERKKARTLICWVYVAQSPKIFPKPNFARLFRSMT